MLESTEKRRHKVTNDTKTVVIGGLLAAYFAARSLQLHKHLCDQKEMLGPVSGLDSWWKQDEEVVSGADSLAECDEKNAPTNQF
jgi:hypothetical protein